MDTLKNTLLPLLLFVALILLAIPDNPIIVTLPCDISVPEYEPLPGQSPCWQGITPGITLLDETRKLLITRYGASHVTLTGNRLTWETRAGENSFGGWIFADPKYIVQDVTIRFAETRLTATDLMNRVGQPAEVIVSQDISANYCSGASLVFPDGIIAVLYPGGDAAGVTARQSVQTLELMPPAKMKSQPTTDIAAIDWQGFTDYCALTGWQDATSPDTPGG